MVSFLGISSFGGVSWICGRELDLGSTCIQRTIIDVLNLLFLGVFYLLLLVSSIKKHYDSGNNRRDWVSIAVSICCALTAIAYLGAGLRDLIANNGDGFMPLSWLVNFLRGLIWISLAVSLIVKRSKWIRILISVWWVFFFLLVSALNIEILVETKGIQILDMVPWPVNFLLLLCALRNFCHFVSQHASSKSLSDPLLVEKSEKGRTGLAQAGFLSQLTFSWISSLFRLGYSKPLTLEDIPCLVSKDEANLAYQNFADAWDVLQRKKSSNDTGNLVLRALAKVYVKEMVFVGICALLRTVSVVLSPLLLYAFVNYSNRNEENLYEGLFLLGCLVVTKVVESLSQRHWFFDSRRAGMRMRSALMVAIYKKQLKLSSLGRRRHSTGEIVNYIAVDAYRMGEFLWWFHSTWNYILQLFLAIAVLFGVVGLGALPGLVPLLICGLLNVPFAKILQKCQSQFMKGQDERLRSTSEILNNMKIIKLQSWEDKFKNMIESLRDIEFKWLAKAQFKKSYATVLYWMSPTLISSVVFLGCALFKSSPLLVK